MTAPHHEQHGGDFTARLNWLRASVLGANDGIISMAALLVGVAAAAPEALVVTGTAGLLAGAFSMAAGEYVSVSSQRDSEQVLLAKERYELEHFKESEHEELVGIYERKGLSPATALQVANELTAHDVFAAHVDAELGIDPNYLVNPWHAGLASAVSYTIGGAIPFIAILLPVGMYRIPGTCAAVVLALGITGVVSARISGASAIASTLRIVFWGLAAMFVTYAVGYGIGHVG